MAEEVVVKDTLTEQMILAGSELLRTLDDARLAVIAALWIYTPEANHWRVLLASPEFRIEGPKKIYKQIQSVIQKMSDDKKRILSGVVTVIDSKDSLIALLRSAIRTGNDISGIRFSRNVVNGVLIEDAYIYRMT